MSYLQFTCKNPTSADLKSRRGSDEGKIYEKLCFALLAKNGYELSQVDSSQYRHFAIGRDVGIGKDAKFDDIVFRYTDQHNTTNLIFVKTIYKQDNYKIDSEILSAEASSSKGGGDGGMRRDFNLQKYFISFLNVRDELVNSKSRELENGKMRYVAIFSNVGINTTELKNKGFSFKECPGDIVKLFTLKKPSLEIEQSSQLGFYQLEDISEDLRKILKRSSDLHRLARELAQYVVWKKYRENKIMGIDDAPIKHYHVALESAVVHKSTLVANESSEKQVRKGKYCEAQFRDDFINDDKPGPKQELRDAIFEYIRELDESRKAASDDELRSDLKKVNWKIDPKFGKTKLRCKSDLPCEWRAVKEQDVKDFLRCLVFIVNQPRVTDLQALYNSSTQNTVLEGSLSEEIANKIENVGPELTRRIEENLGIDKKSMYKEKWISGESISNFFEEKRQLLIGMQFVSPAMTEIHESEVMQYGKFKESGKLEESLSRFLSSNEKVLVVKSTLVLLSSIKIFQYFDAKISNITENERITVSLDMLKSKESRENVESAFQSERIILLIIQQTQCIEEHDVNEFYNKLFNIVSSKRNKKIIFIIQQGQRSILPEKLRAHFQSEGQFVLENDFIEIKDFEPAEDTMGNDGIIIK